MKIVDTEVPNSQMLITCKKDGTFNKKIITDIKTYNNFNIEYKKDDERLNELLIHNNDSSDLFVERYIQSVLISKFTSYIEGSNAILPSSFSRKYKNVIEFMSSDNSVYFADLSIKKYSDLIEKLKEITRLEILKMGLKKLKDHNVKYLNLSLKPLSIENGVYGGIFDREYKIKDEYLKEYRYSHYLKNGNADSKVIEDMCKLLDKFVEINGDFYEKFGDEDQIDLFSENGDSIVHINGLKYNEKLKKYTYSLIK